MQDWGMEASRIVDNHIDVWVQSPQFRPLADIAQKDRATLVARIRELFEEKGRSRKEKSDRARSMLAHHVLEQAGIELQVKHFTLFKEGETVRLILEDAFEVEPGREEDKVIIPCQREAVRIVVRCLFAGSKSTDAGDVAVFLQLFADGKDRISSDQDKLTRFKTMVWLAYLLIDLIRVDRSNVCANGSIYLRKKLAELLDKAIEGAIINEDAAAPEFSFEGGKWNDTLYGWLQGEDRRPFVQKLKRQFNLENRSDHVNRLLLANHRDCMYRQAMSLFCR